MSQPKTVIACFVFLLSIIITPSQVAAEKEDTAHLSFEKTADLKNDESTYVVKKGDWLANIIRQETGLISYAEINEIIKQIKLRNPKIKNLNIIQPGQILQIPLALSSTFSKTGSASTVESTEDHPSQSIHDEAVKPQAFVKNADNLSILKQIISNMKGTFTTSGLYHIPLPKSGQVTIDCDKIAVAEFDDGTTSLFDFSNSMPKALKNLIQSSWKHYHIVNSDSRDDMITVLQKLITPSKSYAMAKMSKLFNVHEKSQIQVYADWVITKKSPQGPQQYIQTLSFLRDDAQLQPRPIVRYADKNGLFITEIVEKQGISKSRPLSDIMLNMTNLNAKTNGELIFALLVSLGYTPDKDADVKVYNLIKDEGYNLTVKVDYLLTKDDRRYVITSNTTSKEILDILKEGNFEIILYGHEELPRELFGKLLRLLNIPFAFNTFSFTFPEKGMVRAVINMPAFRIAESQHEPVFLIDFDMDNEIYHLLHSIWRLKIIKY
jgi:LysM repeat protein